MGAMGLAVAVAEWEEVMVLMMLWVFTVYEIGYRSRAVYGVCRMERGASTMKWTIHFIMNQRFHTNRNV
jgi:hypothetical protein